MRKNLLKTFSNMVIFAAFIYVTVISDFRSYQICPGISDLPAGISDLTNKSVISDMPAVISDLPGQI